MEAMSCHMKRDVKFSQVLVAAVNFSKAQTCTYSKTKLRVYNLAMFHVYRMLPHCCSQAMLETAQLHVKL